MTMCEPEYPECPNVNCDDGVLSYSEECDAVVCDKCKSHYRTNRDHELVPERISLASGEYIFDFAERIPHCRRCEGLKSDKLKPSRTYGIPSTDWKSGVTPPSDESYDNIAAQLDEYQPSLVRNLDDEKDNCSHESEVSHNDEAEIRQEPDMISGSPSGASGAIRPYWTGVINKNVRYDE